MKRIISFLLVFSMILPGVAVCAEVSTSDIAQAQIIGEYKVIEGAPVFFEDFEADNPAEGLIAGNSFVVEKSLNGTQALHIKGTSQTIATGNFGPELDNFLVEADAMLTGCNASTNGGFFISARKSSKTSPSYNMLYTDVNKYSFQTGLINNSESLRDRLAIARSNGSPNIGSSWFWTKMAKDEVGILDLSARSFAEFVHFKFYMSDIFVRCEIYSKDGKLLTSIEQLTDDLDKVAGGGFAMPRLKKGNVQLGTHSCDVWFDNITIKQISVIKTAEIKTSAEVMLTDNEYEIWTESENGAKIPFEMIQWEYDNEELFIDNGKITPKNEGEFTVTAKYDTEVISKVIKVKREYAFEDYDVILDRSNVFLGEKINITLKGVYEGNEYKVIKNINVSSSAGKYDGNTLITDTQGKHNITIVYNGIKKILPVYVSGYSAASIEVENESVSVGETRKFSVWATRNNVKERISVGKYKIKPSDGFTVNGESFTTTRTGERTLYAEVDNVQIEKVFNIGQLSEGEIFKEDFEDNYYSEFFNVPADRVITDTDGNKVYRMYDEFSPYYGHADWYNYKVSGKVKIKNRRIDDRRYNTSFGVYVRQTLVTDPNMTGGEKGIPLLYALDKDFQYLRIGAQNGQLFVSEDDVWYEFSAECMDNQFIFTFGNTKICYNVDIKEYGGFHLNAENTEVYLDDIKVQRNDGIEELQATKLEIINDGVTLDEYANREITALIAVKAVDKNGKYKYVSMDAEYRVLSDNAEIVSDTYSLKIKEGSKEPVLVGVTYGGLSAQAEIIPTSTYSSRTEYLKATQEIRNRNFAFKLMRSASLGRVLDTSHLYFASYATGLLTIQPKRKNYDHVIQWYIDITRSEAANGISNADFTLNILLTIRYELKGIVNVSDEMWEKVDELLSTFDYGEKDEAVSENHRIALYADALLAAEAIPDGAFYKGKTAKEVWDDFAGYIVDWINYRYKNGFQEYDSTYLAIDVISFIMLHNYTQNDSMKKICKDFLDWMYGDMVQDSIEDRLSGAHGRTYFNSDIVAKCYWLAQTFENEGGKWKETGSAYGVQPAVLAFQQYIPHDIVYEIEQNRKDFVNKERRMLYTIPDYEVSESLCKYTYVTEDYSLGCINNLQNPYNSSLVLKGDKYYNSDDIWVLTGHQEFSMSAAIRGNDKRILVFNHPGPKGYENYTDKHNYYSGYYNYPAFNYMQEKNTIIGVYYIDDENQRPYTHCFIPKSTFEKVDEEEGWIFLLTGDVYTAIKPLTGGRVMSSPQYRWGDNVLFTGSNINLAENEILLENKHSGFVMHITSKEETQMNFEEFKSAMKNTNVEYTLDNNGTLTYTGLDGKTMKVVYDTNEDFLNGEKQDYSNYKLFDSEFIQSDYRSGITKMSAGGKDLTIMPVKISSSKESILAINNRITEIPDKLNKMGGIQKSKRLEQLDIQELCMDIIYTPNEYVQTVLWEKLIKVIDKVTSSSVYDTEKIVQELEVYTDIEFHGEFVKRLIEIIQ